MNHDVIEASDPGDPRSAIRAYARRMCDTLGQYIGVIAQASDPIARSVYQAATLEQYDPQELRDWSAQSPAEGPIRMESDRAQKIASPVPEQKLLSEWRAEGYRKPLLIVAPAGSGKSCLLESFALQMAKDLLDDAIWPESDPWPIGVPLLISLAKMSDTPLNEYLSLAENDLTDSEATLSGSIMTDLQRQGRLVLLIDGFDEVPTAHELLVRMLKKWKGGFALTSRPGHGERRVVPDTLSQRTLQELKVDHARGYVRAYFTERPCIRTPTARIVETFDRTWKTHFGRFLRRPLYLKTWCDYVNEEEGKRFPASLGNLAHLTLLRTLEARHELDSVPPADRHDIIRGFIDWFGRLGLLFAKEEFGPQQTERIAGCGLLGNDADRVVQNGKEFVFERIAKRCGLLMYSKQRDTYEIPKLPLVEYVIGKYLADDAIRYPKSPQILIDTFQHWVWRPDRHEILDYTFDALWHRSQGEKEPQWANTFLRWAKDVGNADAQHTDMGHNAVHDDYGHPFAIAVLRWRLLQPNPPEQVVNDDVKLFAPAFTRVFTSVLSNSYLSDELIAPDSVIVRIINEMVERYSMDLWWGAIRAAAGRIQEEAAADLIVDLMQRHNRARGDEAAHRACREAISGIASQVREEAAADFIAQCLEQHDRARGDEATQEIWRKAVGEAAGRVHENDVSDVVVQLIKQYHEVCRELDEDEEYEWRYAIRAAATRVCENTALEVVAQWLEECERVALNSGIDLGWYWAIRAGANRVREDVAADFIIHCMEQHERTREDEEVQRGWAEAIEGASSRVREDAAATIVVQLIKRREQAHLRDAITGAAGRIPEEAAADVVTQWIEQHDRAHGDEVAQRAWCAAIAGAAGRVREDDAADLIAQWIKEHNQARGDQGAELARQVAIQAAAGRVREDDAANLIAQWIEQHNRASGDQATQEVWRKAICQAVGRVHEEAAADLVLQLIKQHDQASGERFEQWTWRSAIRVVASRIREDTAAELVIQWMEQRDRARGNEAAQEAWHEAIKAAVCRVSEATDRRDSDSPMMRLCNALFVSNDGGLAFTIAANNPSVAIISIANEAQPASDAEKTQDMAFKAVLRRDQMLDKDLVVAPRLVRAAFIEKRLLALENSHSDAGFASGVPEVTGQAIADIEGVRSDINALKEFAEFAARCRDFEGRLAAIVSKLGRIPPLDQSQTSPHLGGSTPSDAEAMPEEAKRAILKTAPDRAIIEYRTDPKVLVTLQKYYEIGYELYPRADKSLNKIGERFRERSETRTGKGLRPLPKEIDFPIGAKSFRPFMTRCVQEAKRLFGTHFGASDDYKQMVDSEGNALLFKEVNGIYRGFTDLGWKAWEICRHDLLFHGLITESDLPGESRK